VRDTRVAKRYAQALFQVAQSSDVIASVEDDFNGIAGLIANDPDFKDFLLSPYVSRDEKIAIAEKLFSDRITALSMSAVRLLLRKGREAEMVGVRDAFVAMRREHGGVLFVEVVTAEELENDQRQKLEMKLAKRTARTVEATYTIDPHLVGGIRVTYDSYVFDGSVRGQFRRIKDLLLHDVLKQV
jgi:F-type H+-transporting ATPase subunit delta